MSLRPALTHGVALVACLAAAMLILALAAPAPAQVLSTCEFPGLDRAAQCTTVVVPEDPAQVDGRQLPLRVVLLPAREGPSEPDPVFFLVGGPGLAASDSAGMFGDSFTALQRRRDIVLVDQRGTGSSNPLQCPWDGPQQAVRALFTLQFDDGYLGRCLAGLNGDTRVYVTPNAADDLDRVRIALGYDRINILAASYGTRVALAYVRQHQEHVRTVTLRAVSPTFRSFDQLGPGAQRALDGVFDTCDRDARCRALLPNPGRTLVDLLERLEAAPVMVPLPRVEGGRVDELEVTRHWIVGALFQMLYDARLARQIPGLVAAMAGGDFRPLLQVAGAAAGVLAGLHVGAYLSVLCAEEVPFLSTDARIDTGSIFDGSNARRHMRETCRQWPEAALAADYKDPVTAPVPTLLLSGRLDPTTPPELAAAQAERLSQSHHVVVEGLSHLPTWTSCFTGLIATFVDRGSVHGLPSACEDAAPGR